MKTNPATIKIEMTGGSLFEHTALHPDGRRMRARGSCFECVSRDGYITFDERYAREHAAREFDDPTPGSNHIAQAHPRAYRGWVVAVGPAQDIGGTRYRCDAVILSATDPYVEPRVIHDPIPDGYNIVGRVHRTQAEAEKEAASLRRTSSYTDGSRDRLGG